MLGSTAMRGLCASFAVYNALHSSALRDELDLRRLLHALAHAADDELPVLVRLIRQGGHRAPTCHAEY